MNKSREFVIDELNKRYPRLDASESESFDGTSNAIWLRGTENGATASDRFPLFNYYAEDLKEVRYVMGVHKEIIAFLNSLGWYAEWYDAGTILLFEI